MPARIVLASRNAHKIEELSRMAPEVEWLLLPDSAGDPPETGATFEANALQKARFGAAATGLPCLADDSGIEVDALGGRPGVWSKRYSPEATDAANNALLLRELADVGALSPGARSARYRCVIALVAADGAEQVFDGRCEGTIGFSLRGSNGFGYDPLFLPAAVPGRAMAELEPAEKDAISHRGAALQAYKQATGRRE
jgi:XTP/dITP diphosphohydrolase